MEIKSDLQKFKKADKVRKQVLASRAGYATTDAYLKWLQENGSKSSLKEQTDRKKLSQLADELDTTFKKLVAAQSKEKQTKPTIKDDFKIGDIVTIAQHYKVSQISNNIGLNVKLENIEGFIKGQEVGTDLQTLKNIFKSGDNFKYQEEKTRTELIEILESNKHSCMTVGFYKKNTEKSKSQYELEKRQRIEKIKSANLASVDSLLNDLVDNPITRTIPGEYRIMRGYHYNTHNAHGYLQFIDADSKEENKMKSINTRTIDLVICGNTKYVLKK